MGFKLIIVRTSFTIASTEIFKIKLVLFVLLLPFFLFKVSRR